MFPGQKNIPSISIKWKTVPKKKGHYIIKMKNRWIRSLPFKRETELLICLDEPENMINKTH